MSATTDINKPARPDQGKHMELHFMTLVARQTEKKCHLL